jgi:hypothetical protein
LKDKDMEERLNGTEVDIKEMGHVYVNWNFLV